MEKKIIKIHPSELGSWIYCKKKWLFEYMKRLKKLPQFSSSPDDAKRSHEKEN